MVKLELYTEEFKKEYYSKVKNQIPIDKIQDIVRESKDFLPENFYSTASEDEFEELILAPFAKLKEAKEHIAKKSYGIMRAKCFEKCVTDKVKEKLCPPFDLLYSQFGNVMKSFVNKETMRVKIANNNGKLTVCPFCNRDYINSRGGSRSGAQIDHFYPRTVYPVFSLCLYNLVPVCGNCNRIKSNSTVNFASPWDETIDWNSAIRFSYKPKDMDSYQIVIKAKGNAKNNINKMHIREAYSIHSSQVEELLEKQRFYSETQKEEFQDVLKELSISDQDIKRMIFGSEITSDKLGTKSLGRMTRDLHKRLGIY